MAPSGILAGMDEAVALTQALIERARERREDWQRRADALRGEVAHAVARLREEGAVRQCWLIGSLAWGGYGPDSDVDLVIEGLRRERWAAVWRSLSTELGTRLDLLRLEDLPAAFAERVRHEGIELS